jgi:DNA-binding protein H-NS
MSNRAEYVSNLRRSGRLYQSRRDWLSLKKNKKENSKQINRIQTRRGTVREQIIPKNINPLKTIRRRNSKKGGRGGTRRSSKKNCKKNHRHTKSCRR